MLDIVLHDNLLDSEGLELRGNWTENSEVDYPRVGKDFESERM